MRPDFAALRASVMARISEARRYLAGVEARRLTAEAHAEFDRLLMETAPERHEEYFRRWLARPAFREALRRRSR